MEKENESVIKYLPSKESLGPDDFSAEIYQILKKPMVSIFLKLFQKY